MLLGDSHNNKRYVRFENGVVLKPRNCHFEYLFLDPNSPLRTIQEIKEVFRFFPELNFKLNDNLWNDSEVEFLNLSKIQLEESAELGSAIGNIIAVSLFFGLTDLHFGNVMFGLDDRGKFILGPVDIECLLAPIRIPSQTHLFDSKNISKDFGGLVAIRNELGSNSSKLIPIILKSFIRSWEQLLLAKNKIIDIFTSAPYKQSPLRVVLKATRIYHQSLGLIDLSQFIPEEVEQLKRGDIPYFFCTLDDKNLYFLNDQDEVTKVQNLDLTKISTWPKIDILRINEIRIKDLAPAIAEICHVFRNGINESFTEEDISYWDDSKEFGVVINGVKIKCV